MWIVCVTEWPSPVCKTQGQDKYSYLVAHGRMTVITMG